MKIHLVSHHLQLTEPIQACVETKIAALAEISAHVQSADVILSQDKGINPTRRFTISARLAMPGKDIQASNTGADLYAVIDGLQSKLARRLRKRKTRFALSRQTLRKTLERLRFFRASGEGNFAAS